MADPVRKRGERGAALILVLWMTVLMSAVVAVAAVTVRAGQANATADRSLTTRQTGLMNAVILISVLPLEPEGGELPGGFSYGAPRAPLLWPVHLHDNERLRAALRDVVEDEAALDYTLARLKDWQDRDDSPAVIRADAVLGADTEKGARNRPFLTLGEVTSLLDMELGELKCNLKGQYAGDVNATTSGHSHIFVISEKLSNAKYKGVQLYTTAHSRSRRQLTVNFTPNIH